MPNSIFANARASVLETTLLGAERFLRMADCASPDEAIKILQETGFGDGTEASAGDTERLVEAEEKKLAAFIREASPDDRLARFLLAEYDFRNAEAVMRAKHLRLDFRPMCGTEGAYPLSLLESKIYADDYGRFDAPLRCALAAADELFVGGGATGRTVNTLFTRAMYEELMLLAGKRKELREIASVRADAANIGVALRARSWPLTQETMVPGGSLKGEELRVLAEESADAIREKMRFSPRRELVCAALENFAEGQPLTLLERAADSAALLLLKKKRYSDEGYLPFLRYCYYKLAELRNVTIVFACLENGVDRSVVRARMRESYEGQNGYHR